MVMTKAGKELVNEARENSGSSTRLGRIGAGVGRAVNPLITGGFIGASVASGEQSLGEAVGDAVGGYAGWGLGSSLSNRLTSKFFPNAGLWGKAVNLAAGLIGAGIGSSVGNTVLGAALPFRRSPQEPEKYFQSGTGNTFSN